MQRHPPATWQKRSHCLSPLPCTSALNMKLTITSEAEAEAKDPSKDELWTKRLEFVKLKSCPLPLSALSSHTPSYCSLSAKLCSHGLRS